MATISAQTLKGFRDFAPAEARKRQYVISRLRSVFESYGFEPLETPALEYEEVLLGKYGTEGDKLMYRFEDNGKRRVAMRYDQTVPLARFIAQNYQSIALPFKRYQIQSVWRAENTQKGRYREFLQCDIDTVGTIDSMADAEIIATAAKGIESLGFKNIKIFINDRTVFDQFKKTGFLNDKDLPKALRSLDKLKKIGDEGVIKDLQKNGFSKDVAVSILQNAKLLQKNDYLVKIFKYLISLGLKDSQILFDGTLTRGLDYYTSTIFEIEIEGYGSGAIGGGGRYDNLIGMFAGKQIPAVGFSFGFDRMIEAMEEQKLFPKELTESTTKVLVTVFPQFQKESVELASQLRNAGINTELYLAEAKLEKQLKYADKKGVPYVIVIGAEEVKEKVVTLKSLKDGKQEKLTLDKLIKRLSSRTKWWTFDALYRA